MMCIFQSSLFSQNSMFAIFVSEPLQRLVSCSMGHLKIQINKQYLLRWKLHLRDKAPKTSNVVVVDGDDSSGRKRFVVWNKKEVLELEYKK